MVALALEPAWALCSGDWNSWDMENEAGLRLQVKQSAARQSWGSVSKSPRFSIAPTKRYWVNGMGWVPHEGRLADIYVFGWHPIEDETADHRNPRQRTFFVVRERDLPKQKSVSVQALNRLASMTGFIGLKNAVENAADSVFDSG